MDSVYFGCRMLIRGGGEGRGVFFFFFFSRHILSFGHFTQRVVRCVAGIRAPLSEPNAFSSQPASQPASQPWPGQAPGMHKFEAWGLR